MTNRKPYPKHKRTRRDAYAGYGTRDSRNYRGRSRTDIWKVMEKAHDIITFQHIKEWEKDFGINKSSWLKLFFRYTEAHLNNIPFENLPEYLGLGKVEIERDSRTTDRNTDDRAKEVQKYKRIIRIINKLTTECSILWDIYDTLIDFIEKAKERNNKDDKLFIHSVKNIWGDYLKDIIGGFKISKKGKPIREAVQNETI